MAGKRVGEKCPSCGEYAVIHSAPYPCAAPVEATDTGGAAEDAESVARLFHETYERLAPKHGYRTREASAVPWEQVPAANRALMVETVGVVLAELARLRAENERLRDGLPEFRCPSCGSVTRARMADGAPDG